MKFKQMLIHLPWILWFCLLLFLSFLPGHELPRFSFLNADKLLHALFYCIQFILIVFAFNPYSQKKGLLFFVVFSLIGCIIEFIQGNFISGRVTDYFDALANAAGLLVALLIAYKTLLKK